MANNLSGTEIEILSAFFPDLTVGEIADLSDKDAADLLTQIKNAA